MPADPTILERIRGRPFARGGRVLVRFRANGYSLAARRSGVPLARLRLTGGGDDVVLLYPSPRGWEPPGEFGAAAMRSTSPSSSSAPIRTSWNSARPTAERRHTARQRSTPDPLPCKLQQLESIALWLVDLV